MNKASNKRCKNLKESEHRPNFDKLLLEAVDDALASLGDQAKEMIYSRLEKAAGIKKKDIPCEVEKFAQAMREILGSGANLLEIYVMKKLYERIGKDFKYHLKSAKLVFSEYVDAARSSNLPMKDPEGSNGEVAAVSHLVAIAKYA